MPSFLGGPHAEGTGEAPAYQQQQPQSPLVMTPQTTGQTAYHDPNTMNINPQATGGPAPAYNNEKIDYNQASPQPQQGYVQPQQQQQAYVQPQQQYAQQQHPSFQQQPSQQSVPVMQKQSMYQSAIPLASLQGNPAPVDCPICHNREMTRVDYQSGGYTHVAAALLCFVFCLGCIPYLITSLKDVVHKCGHCGATLAIWHRSGRTEVLAHPSVARPQ